MKSFRKLLNTHISYNLKKDYRKLNLSIKFYKNAKTGFCSDNKNNKDDSRYTYEYQSPENKEIDAVPASEYYSFLLLKIGIAGFAIFTVFFKKYNELSKNREIYFVNDTLQNKLAEFISKKIIEKYKHQIYKQDTLESRKVWKIYEEILNKNNIEFKEISEKNVFVINSPSIGAFLTLNGNLFISDRVLEIADFTDDEIGLLIACELAHLLMGKATSRYFNILYDKSGISDSIKIFYKRPGPGTLKSENFDKISEINKFLYFYPESIVSSYYLEKDVLKLAVKILYNTGYNLDQVKFLC